MKYNFTTLNVRGLRNKKKRRSMFNWLNRYNSHFILLQEAYCNENDIANWEQQWGGTFYANHGTNHSCGILIGIKNNVDIKCEKVYSDNHGRLLCIRMDVNDNRYYLWNVYAPNDIYERKTFLIKSFDIIQNNSSDGHVIIGGDFNTVLNPQLDKIGGKTPNPICGNIIKKFLSDNETVDIWRVKHGQEKRFTWKQNNPPIYSTLDYWFIPATMDAITTSVDILTTPKSDHLAVNLCLSFDTTTRGNNYWKFNNEWLENNDFTDCLLKMIHDCENTYRKTLTSAEFWALCKNKIRSFCIKFACNSNVSKNCKMSDIEKKLKEIYIDMTNNPTDESLKCTYNKLRFEYEILNEHHLKGLQLRSKTKWVEEGEKSTKYFLNLEKCNSYRKVM